MSHGACEVVTQLRNAREMVQNDVEVAVQVDIVDVPGCQEAHGRELGDVVLTA